MEQSYKEKYEKALEKIKNLIDKDHNDINVDDILNVFPELTESEDEKVRKELIKHLKELSDWKEDEVIPVKNPSYYRQWASWLEKQGQVKESFISQHENKMCKENDDFLTSEGERIINIFRKVIYGCNKGETQMLGDKERDDCLAWLERQGEHANFRNKIQVGDKVTRNEAGVLVNLSQLKRVAKPSEKQDEKHPDPYNGISFEYNGHIWGMCARDNGVDISCDKHLIKHLEKQDEQKPADKVEPKFKVGEKELTNEELCEGLIRGMVNEHNRVTKEVLRNEYEKGRADVLAKIDAIDVDEMVCESGATSRVTQYWYAHGVNDVIKKLKKE